MAQFNAFVPIPNLGQPVEPALSVDDAKQALLAPVPAAPQPLSVEDAKQQLVHLYLVFLMSNLVPNPK